MVDETAGDDGRNGTGGDRVNVALSNSTFRPTGESRTHGLHQYIPGEESSLEAEEYFLDGDDGEQDVTNLLFNAKTLHED